MCHCVCRTVGRKGRGEERGEGKGEARMRRDNRCEKAVVAMVMVICQ